MTSGRSALFPRAEAPGAATDHAIACRTGYCGLEPAGGAAALAGCADGGEAAASVAAGAGCNGTGGESAAGAGVAGAAAGGESAAAGAGSGEAVTGLAGFV